MALCRPLLMCLDGEGHTSTWPRPLAIGNEADAADVQLFKQCSGHAHGLCVRFSSTACVCLLQTGSLAVLFSGRFMCVLHVGMQLFFVSDAGDAVLHEPHGMMLPCKRAATLLLMYAVVA